MYVMKPIGPVSGPYNEVGFDSLPSGTVPSRWTATGYRTSRVASPGFCLQLQHTGAFKRFFPPCRQTGGNLASSPPSLSNLEVGDKELVATGIVYALFFLLISAIPKSR